MKYFAVALMSSVSLAIKLKWDPEPTEHTHFSKEEVVTTHPIGSTITVRQPVTREVEVEITELVDVEVERIRQEEVVEIVEEQVEIGT